MIMIVTEMTTMTTIVTMMTTATTPSTMTTAMMTTIMMMTPMLRIMGERRSIPSCGLTLMTGATFF